MRFRRTPSDRLRAAMADPAFRAAIDADLRRRATRVQGEAVRATGARRGRTSAEADLEPIRVTSERLDLPPELEP